MELCRLGKNEVLGEKCVPLPLRLPLISHWLARDLTGASHCTVFPAS